MAHLKYSAPSAYNATSLSKEHHYVCGFFGVTNNHYQIYKADYIFSDSKEVLFESTKWSEILEFIKTL